jgi:hypothetical protein
VHRLLLMLVLALPSVARAEPYLAVIAGLKCSACHVNPTGGGMRNTMGNVWGQTMLPARTLDMSGGPWTGEINRFMAVGADLRAGATRMEIPDRDATTSFDLNSLRLYLDLRVIPDRLSVYIDQRMAPGSSSNAEAYLKLWSKDHRFYAKAGQLYLPYGIRLQDDGAFTREVTSINFSTPDRGVEFGFDGARWTAQLAVTNGTAGGAEVDNGKQWSLRTEYVTSRWRAGASFNLNDFEQGSRQMQNLFAGLRTGPVAWLAEVDLVMDSAGGPDLEQWSGLLEANWTVRKGHNLKLTAEIFEPDHSLSRNGQTRLSFLWEYTPIAFLQLRAGVRNNDDDDGIAFQNQRIYFLQIHGYL